MKRFTQLWLAALVGMLAAGTWLTVTAQGPQPPVLIYGVRTNGLTRPVAVDDAGNFNISANISGADGALQDGVTASIRATVFNLTNAKPLATQIVDAAGSAITSFGGGSQYTQDAALTIATTAGTMAMGRASTTAPTDVSAANDAVLPWYLPSGAQVSQVAYGNVLAATGSGVTTTGTPRVTFATDAPQIKAMLVNAGGTEIQPSVDATVDSPIGTTGPLLLGRGSTAAPAAMSTDGDATPIWLDLLGRVHVAAVDACEGLVKVPVPFSISTATTTQLVAASAGNRAYICAINLTNSTADNVALVEDDTAACASPTAGMAGGLTAASGWNLAANSGLTLGNGQGTVAATAVANRYVCLITSSTAQVSGTVMYALAP